MYSCLEKGSQGCGKVDKEKLNPSKTVASFPSIKQGINCGTGDLPLVSTINILVGKYQLNGYNAYIFSRDRQYIYLFSGTISSI